MDLEIKKKVEVRISKEKGLDREDKSRIWSRHEEEKNATMISGWMDSLKKSRFDDSWLDG